MQKRKVIFFNLFLLIGLLIVVEISLRIIFPDYQYYYRTHYGQPDLEEILAKTDTSWLSPSDELGWVCQQKELLQFPSPPVESVVYQINEQGFRNPFDFQDSFPANKKRILLLGDSFMFGIYLQDQKTIVSQLQKSKGEEYVFINVSAPGWGLDQIYLAYQKYVDLIKPDQIILAFVDDDLMRSLEIIFHGCGLKPCMKIAEDNLIPNKDDPHFWEYLCWNNQIGNRLLRIYYEQKAINLARFLLTDIIRQEKESGRKPSFVRIPALVDLQNKEPRTVFNMTTYMETQEVNYLELYDTLTKQNFYPLYIPNDGHFTEKGASFLSEKIVPWIK